MQINELKQKLFNFLKKFKNQNDIFKLMNYLVLLSGTYQNDFSKFRCLYILSIIHY